MKPMTTVPPFQNLTGYSRKEFGAIFQLYSRNVYRGLFKDFSFTEHKGQFFISFREEAGKQPLITIEKRRFGPDRVLFLATMLGPKHTMQEIARSEKLDAFVRQLEGKIAIIRSARKTVKNL